MSKLIEEMRNWVIDCSVDDDDLQDRIDASDKAIVKYVEKYYCGGLAQFKIDGQ